MATDSGTVRRVGADGSPLRPRSPAAPSTPPYGQGGLDGSEGQTARKFVDYKMDPAPSWNGEHPESEYREYARNLKLWLIEAEARLPPSLIGKRILDVILFGSRLAASLLLPEGGKAGASFRCSDLPWPAAAGPDPDRLLGDQEGGLRRAEEAGAGHAGDRRG